MKILGKNSLASGLWVVVNIIWFLQWFGTATLLVTLATYAFRANESILVSLPISFNAEDIEPLQSVSLSEKEVKGLSVEAR